MALSFEFSRDDSVTLCSETVTALEKLILKTFSRQSLKDFGSNFFLNFFSSERIKFAQETKNDFDTRQHNVECGSE